MPRRGKEPKFMGYGLPPDAVLDQCRATPDMGYLFDHDAVDFERPPSREYRHAQARSVCNGYGELDSCPVREQCLLWALSNEERGVFGGVSVSSRMINRYKREVARELELLIMVKETA